MEWTTRSVSVSVEVSLLHNGEILDQVIQPLGLRFYRIDPDEGFFLNGKHLPLRGVCRHQDRSEIGNALHPEHHEEDAALMLEMGVNACDWLIILKLLIFMTSWISLV